MQEIENDKRNEEFFQENSRLRTNIEIEKNNLICLENEINEIIKNNEIQNNENKQKNQNISNLRLELNKLNELNIEYEKDYHKIDLEV